eukprot:GABW01004599.1.p1 GENE.GABW01004599.1~~GABW01004599.1.p1  ORF type:complete len:101 (-),score=25.00 GABW01004599.1:3-305(-)
MVIMSQDDDRYYIGGYDVIGGKNRWSEIKKYQELNLPKHCDLDDFIITSVLLEDYWQEVTLTFTAGNTCSGGIIYNMTDGTHIVEDDVRVIEKEYEVHST